MSAELRIYLPLSNDLIEKYRELSQKDKKQIATIYEKEMGIESRNLRNLISQPERFQPNYEERQLLTEEITKRWNAAFVPEHDLIPA